MPPRHITPQTLSAIRAAASRRFALMALCLLTVTGAARVQAQSMPPAVATPADPFHQPCVDVRASPEMDGPPHVSQPGAAATMPSTNRIVRKQYVDLDNRCATPPAFAPTRDIDSTSVWYVDAPAGARLATSRRVGASALHGLAS
ncbi:hypothetical protein [Pandoraea bronchicola]|uniref:Lipoprotein n=1 Tax=Pandoraea bronchicola TaxID=2508287 RepID=A0A5E5BPU8_9BURK|nr:hypothetical protein [Pandoraea bronchicola]VVE87327.1 hypothetical protein PBR20603_01256 [Pandoraea bronchicola]